MMHPQLAGRCLRGFRPLQSRNRSARTNAVRAVMGNYQYNFRANKLRSKGVDVYEFGTRQLREGAFGEDVLQLQNWLADEQYYNPMDGGYTGYFGSVTKESLQAWQRDNGLQATGIFDSASKWTYLRNMESRATVDMSFVQGTTSASVAVPSSYQPSASTSSANAGAPFFIAAAAVAGLAVALPYIKKIAIPFFVNKKNTTTEVAAAEEEMMMMNYQYQYEEIANQEEEEVAAPITVTEQTTQKPSRLRRLSDEELQRRIAPFKKNSKDSTPIAIKPIPQRATPRTGLDLTKAPTSQSGAVSSRHGTYYGGRKVLDQVKQYLIEQNGMPAPVGAPAQRMQNLGYDMAKKPAAAKKPDPIVSPLQVNKDYRPSSFEDIPAAEDDFKPAKDMTIGMAMASTELLTGTELEKAPESPLKAVAVVKPGAAAARAPVEAVKSAAAPVDPRASVVLHNKPVKLHKPARLVQSGSSFDDSE